MIVNAIAAKFPMVPPSPPSGNVIPTAGPRVQLVHDMTC
jgi:hypothetical protein